MLFLALALSLTDGDCRPNDRMNKFGRNNCRDGFCYDYILMFLLTGPLELVTADSEDVLLDHYAVVGYDRDQTIAEGRRAADYFYALYSIDFRGLSDADILTGNHTDLASGAVFAPFIVYSEETLRLYMAATKCGFDFLNVPMLDAGWSLAFFQDHPPTTGNVSEIVPAGSFSVFGSYIIDVCGRAHDSHRFCHNILLPKRSRGPVFIKYRTRTVIPLSPSLSEPAFLVNCDLQNEFFGEGIIRGTVFLTGVRASDGIRLWDGRYVLTFPPLREPP